jgi:regulator of cell morphogenesis and NO signaling
MTLSQQTLGEIVASNYRAAAVFEKYNIDFCCQGDRLFLDACRAAGVDPDALGGELSHLEAPTDAVDFKQWPLDLLTQYIQSRHHHYVESVTPSIRQLLDKICDVHGSHHPELHEIRDIFNSTSGDLAVHMKKEELILFPFIRQLSAARQDRRTVKSKIFDSVTNPIHDMKDDHLEEGEQLERMSAISNHFTPPADACMSFVTAYRMLKEYEADMHQHIHLENNILFPAAIRLEEELRIVL